MGSPSEFEENNGQSESSYEKHFISFRVYVLGCLLCTFFGGVIGWAIRDMLVK